jgi:hypothetical protein
MLASFAEYDRQSIIERTCAGLRRAFKNGRHGGAILYGYDIAPDGLFVVVEEEAAQAPQCGRSALSGQALQGQGTHQRRELGGLKR